MSDATKIQNPSITPKDFTIQDNKIIAINGILVSGAGGTMSDYVYYPSYDETNGDITFTLGTIQGHTGPFGPYHISGAQGEQGASGVSPTVTVTNISADPTDPNHKKGGTEITITDATTTNKFSAWNGNDGTMADAPDIEGKNGISAILDGSTYKVGLSGTFYNAVTSVSSKLNESDFTAYTATTAPNTFQAKGNYLSANALNGYATETWVGQQGYLKQDDIAGKADKTELETVSGEIVNMIPSLDGYATKQYVQGASAEVTAWVNEQHYLTAVPDYYITETELANYNYATIGLVDEASAKAYNDATANADNLYLTKTSAHNEFVNTSSWANNTFQVKGNYLSANALNGYATQTWVGSQGYLTEIPSEYVTTATTNSLSSQIDEISSTLNDKYTLSAGDGINFVEDSINKITKIECTVVAPTTVAQLTDSNNYYKKTETSGANELSAEFAKYALLANIPTKVTDLTDSANYVVTGDILTGTGNKLTGIKIGSTSYTVPTTDLSNYYTKSQTSAASELATEFAKYLTTAQYITDSATFVTSGDYISGSKQYVLTSGGWVEISVNTDYTAGTDLKIDENNVISIDTNGSANNIATNNHNFVAGSWTIASGYNCFAEGVATSAFGYGVHAQGMWTCFSSNDALLNGGSYGPIYWSNGAGAAVEGYCNATTACPMSGTVGGSDYGPIHGGIIKVIGNGYVENEEHETTVHEHYPSDALILYRDGSLSAAGKISAAGVELAGKLSIPIDIGSNNMLNIPTADYGTWGNNADGYLVIGNNSKAGNQSYVFGNDSIAQNNSTVLNGGNSALHDSIAQGWKNIAIERSQAFGYNSSANNNSFAAGYAAAATNYSFAGGQAYNGARGNILANDHSFALGVGSNDEPVIANEYSFSFGYGTSAQHWAFAFGKAIDVEGSNGQAVIGVGRYNEKVQNAAIIVGNGTSNNARNNAFVVYNDGNVSAKNYKAEGYTQNNTYVEASVPKSLPNTGDNAMVVQKMFVCTSDPDIVAHINLANGEGCIFFRVG